jgi:hypothetical protein
VGRGKDPRLEGEARGERRDRDEAVLLQDEPAPVAPLLPDDVAPHAALLHPEVARGPLELLGHQLRQDRGRDQLGMRVLEGCSRRHAVVLEDEDVLEPWILPEGEQPLAVRGQDLPDVGRGERPEAREVVGALENVDRMKWLTPTRRGGICCPTG